MGNFPPTGSRCEGDECDELSSFVISIVVFSIFVCCCFALVFNGPRYTETELEQSQNSGLLSNRGSRTRTQEHTGYAQRGILYQPHPQPDINTSGQNKFHDSLVRSRAPTAYHRSNRTLIRAPTRPLRMSYQQKDIEAEILLRGLPQIRCPEDDKRVCTMCLDSLSYTSFIQGSCCHPVHTGCLKHWIATTRNPSCPVCRKALFGNGGALYDWSNVLHSILTVKRVNKGSAKKNLKLPEMKENKGFWNCLQLLVYKLHVYDIFEINLPENAFKPGVVLSINAR